MYLIKDLLDDGVIEKNIWRVESQEKIINSFPNLFGDEVQILIWYCEVTSVVNEKGEAELREDGLVRDVVGEEILKLNDEAPIITILKEM